MNSRVSSVSKVVYIFLISVFSNNYFYIDNFIRYSCLCYTDNWTCNDGGADAKLQLNILKLDKAIIGL